MEVVDGVASLVDKSLLPQVEGAKEPDDAKGVLSRQDTGRSGCWRRSASMRLNVCAKAKRRRPIQCRHASCFLELAESLQPKLGTKEEPAAMTG